MDNTLSPELPTVGKRRRAGLDFGESTRNVDRLIVGAASALLFFVVSLLSPLVPDEAWEMLLARSGRSTFWDVVSTREGNSLLPHTFFHGWLSLLDTWNLSLMRLPALVMTSVAVVLIFGAAMRVTRSRVLAYAVAGITACNPLVWTAASTVRYYCFLFFLGAVTISGLTAWIIDGKRSGFRMWVVGALLLPLSGIVSSLLVLSQVGMVVIHLLITRKSGPPDTISHGDTHPRGPGRTTSWDTRALVTVFAIVASAAIVVASIMRQDRGQISWIPKKSAVDLAYQTVLNLFLGSRLAVLCVLALIAITIVDACRPSIAAKRLRLGASDFQLRLVALGSVGGASVGVIAASLAKTPVYINYYSLASVPTTMVLVALALRHRRRAFQAAIVVMFAATTLINSAQTLRSMTTNSTYSIVRDTTRYLTDTLPADGLVITAQYDSSTRLEARQRAGDLPKTMRLWLASPTFTPSEFSDEWPAVTDRVAVVLAPGSGGYADAEKKVAETFPAPAFTKVADTTFGSGPSLRVVIFTKSAE